MSDVLDRVAKAVGVIIGRIDAPTVSRSMMSDIFDAISDWVHFAFFQSNFHAQSSLSFIKLAVLHILKQAEAFRHRPLSPRRRRWVESLDLFRFLMANVSQVLVDQNFSPFVKLVEIIRRVSDGKWLVP